MIKFIFVNLYDFTNLEERKTPLGILSLYSILEEESNFNPEICDFNKLYFNNILNEYRDFKDNIEKMSKYIISKKPNIISIYTMCNNFYIAIALSEKIKSIDKNISIILAGPHASLVAKETLFKFKFIDYIAIGEGEKTILPICNGIISGDLSNVSGICYRSKGEIISNLNNTSFIDINKVSVLRTIDTINEIKESACIEIEVGRGCPFKCTFCSTQYFWGNCYRVKDINILINELKHYIFKYKVKKFSFQHDLFTFNKKYISKFCDTLIKEDLQISWCCSSRIDVLNKDILRKMSLSGCKTIYFGIESGSQKIQKDINKNLKVESISELIDSLIEYNINAIFSFIYGFPNEESCDLNNTLNLIYYLKKSQKNHEVQFLIQLWPIVFLPGTKLGEEYKNELIYSDRNLYNFNYSTYLDDKYVKELIKGNKEIFLNYYNLEKNLTEEYQYLNSFFMCFFNIAYCKLHKTLDLLILSFDNNIVLLYDEFFKYCKYEIIELSILVNQKIPISVENEFILFIEIMEKFFLKSFIKYKRKDVYKLFKSELSFIYKYKLFKFNIKNTLKLIR